MNHVNYKTQIASIFQKREKMVVKPQKMKGVHNKSHITKKN